MNIKGSQRKIEPVLNLFCVKLNRKTNFLLNFNKKLDKESCSYFVYLVGIDSKHFGTRFHIIVNDKSIVKRKIFKLRVFCCLQNILYNAMNDM